MRGKKVIQNLFLKLLSFNILVIGIRIKFWSVEGRTVFCSTDIWSVCIEFQCNAKVFITVKLFWMNLGIIYLYVPIIYFY